MNLYKKLEETANGIALKTSETDQDIDTLENISADLTTIIDERLDAKLEELRDGVTQMEKEHEALTEIMQDIDRVDDSLRDLQRDIEKEIGELPVDHVLAPEIVTSMLQPILDKVIEIRRELR